MAKHKWTVEIELDEAMIADGADLKAWIIRDALMQQYSYMRPAEISVRVTGAPTPETVFRIQGRRATYSL